MIYHISVPGYMFSTGNQLHKSIDQSKNPVPAHPWCRPRPNGQLSGVADRQRQMRFTISTEPNQILDPEKIKVWELIQLHEDFLNHLNTVITFGNKDIIMRQIFLNASTINAVRTLRYFQNGRWWCTHYLLPCKWRNQSETFACPYVPPVPAPKKLPLLNK